MILSVVQIGNSRGVRLPKTLLEQCHITNKVKVSVSQDNITLEPVHKPREGWEEQMKRLHQQGDDTLLIPDTVDPDFDEWEWK
jgi:antitoxin MazE